jgi:hypothetical protein
LWAVVVALVLVAGVFYAGLIYTQREAEERARQASVEADARRKAEEESAGRFVREEARRRAEEDARQQAEAQAEERRKEEEARRRTAAPNAKIYRALNALGDVQQAIQSERKRDPTDAVIFGAAMSEMLKYYPSSKAAQKSQELLNNCLKQVTTKQIYCFLNALGSLYESLYEEYGKQLFSERLVENAINGMLATIDDAPDIDKQQVMSRLDKIPAIAVSRSGKAIRMVLK